MRRGACAAGDSVDGARRKLAELESHFAEQPVSRGKLGGAFFAAGEPDKAFFWLERAVEERDGVIFPSRCCRCGTRCAPIRAITGCSSG